jgi:hypothetical protein
MAVEAGAGAAAETDVTEIGCIQKYPRSSDFSLESLTVDAAIKRQLIFIPLILVGIGENSTESATGIVVGDKSLFRASVFSFLDDVTFKRVMRIQIGPYSFQVWGIRYIVQQAGSNFCLAGLTCFKPHYNFLSTSLLDNCSAHFRGRCVFYDYDTTYL